MSGKRACAFAFLMVSFSCYSGDYNVASLWGYPNNSGTSVSFEVDWAGKEYSLPVVSQWSWGRPVAQFVRCLSGGGPNTSYRGRSINAVAYPSSVSLIPGFNGIITVQGEEGSAEVNNWKVALGVNSPWEWRTTYTACTQVGDTYQGEYPNGSSTGITAKIKIPNGMPTGIYDISIPARVGLYTQGYNYGSPATLSYSEIFSALKQVDINMKLTVRNACTYDAPSLHLDHGYKILGDAPGNKVTKDITVTCTGPTNVRLSLTSLSTPSSNVAGEYRAGLGNGWDSRLSINGQSSELTDYFTHAGSKKYTIGSELIKGNNSRAGGLSGSAVLVISPE
ncbi:PapG chaperone-binding domain-containing protein [Escherichia marmotae]|uniref:PapG chaperone-binding domain-containing protein n=1 Tax=Escherichia marmotae TaxID=1499973 RepID=UPI002F2CB1CA